MIGISSRGLVLAACVAVVALGGPRARAADWKVVSERTATGFGHTESVAYDPKAKVLYVSDFGPGELKPAEKDGKGHIVKVALDGHIIDAAFLPAHGEVMNKPKGIWVRGDRLWVTDIDAVWVFDLKTRASRRLELPGVVFANDPAVMGNALYVSDNRSDQLVRVSPADFLDAKTTPRIEVVFKGKGAYPNGLYPAPGGTLLMVGFKGKDEPRGIYELAPGAKEPKEISDDIGMLDGLWRAPDGDILATDWVTNSLFRWNPGMLRQKLVGGVSGPADFCVVPEKAGPLVVLPDLVKGELRFVQLGK